MQLPWRSSQKHSQESRQPFPQAWKKQKRGIKTKNSLNHISVVLVEPREGGNIGSTARAMKNMGLQHLKLVNPLESINEQCRRMAGKAIELVCAAPIYSSVDEALTEENVVIGTTSSREREAKQRIHTPREIAALIRKYGESQRVALVFGPERSGLTDTQLARCQYLVSIPSSLDYPVLNLSQAVLVLAYEILTAGPISSDGNLQVASDEEREQMFSHMQQVLLDIGFLNPDNPSHIMRSIRRFLGRADLTPRDVQILRGIMTQMKWYVSQSPSSAGPVRSVAWDKNP
jgi:tRNA/rRNA methyltransferase